MRLFRKKPKTFAPNGFYELSVKSVENLTADSKAISFNIPDNLKATFAFTPGQYLTFAFMIDGKEERRSYSICSGSGEDLTIGVKRVTGGKVSNLLNDDIQPGSKIWVMPPDGRFTYTPGNNENLMLFAAGSGITPILSILKSALQEDSGTKICLVYGNRSEAATMFASDIVTLLETHRERLTVSHTLTKPEEGWQGPVGRLDRVKVADLIDTLQMTGEAQYYICGPNAMMSEVQAALSSRSIPQSKINVEYFTAPVSEGKKDKKAAEKASKNKESEITVIVNDQPHTFTMKGGEVILNKAIEEGIQASFSCMSGICATCMAKLEEGEVSMEDDFALSDEDRDAGYILVCQSHPKSDKVVIRYD